jgi:hypothetical protein
MQRVAGKKKGRDFELTERGALRDDHHVILRHSCIRRQVTYRAKRQHQLVRHGEHRRRGSNT